VVAVRDGQGELAFLTAHLQSKKGREITSTRVSFVFTDWQLQLSSPRATPQIWARANFAFNITLAVILAVALLAGIALAFRTANRALKLSEMKSDFVSNVSHELRTPLASIRVFAEFLRLGRVRSLSKAQEYGEYIEAESRRLTRLINNILDFSRIESGRKTYRFMSADVGEVVASTLKTFDIRLRPSGFYITFEGPEEPTPPVLIDPDAIGQAIHNLLDNAVKFSGDSKEIRVRLVRENDTVVISVQDFGIGIAGNEQSRIFERFHRVSTGLVHDVKGSGLGLSLIHHIVQAHSGRITVESEPNKGSTFSIHLPLEHPEVSQENAAETGTSPSEASDLGLKSGA
jgi:signal transduction histidine kinase